MLEAVREAKGFIGFSIGLRVLLTLNDTLN